MKPDALIRAAWRQVCRRNKLKPIFIKDGYEGIPLNGWGCWPQMDGARHIVEVIYCDQDSRIYTAKSATGWTERSNPDVVKPKIEKAVNALFAEVRKKVTDGEHI